MQSDQFVAGISPLKISRLLAKSSNISRNQKSRFLRLKLEFNGEKNNLKSLKSDLLSDWKSILSLDVEHVNYESGSSAYWRPAQLPACALLGSSP